MSSSDLPKTPNHLFRVLLTFTVVLALGATVPPTTAGQVSVGAHGSYDTDLDIYGVGPGVEVDVDESGRLSLAASLDLFYPESGSLWGLNANARYSFLGSESPVSPYLGAGFNYLNESEEEVFRDLPGGGGIWVGGEESMTGVNLLGGLEFHPFEAVTPFTHVRYTTSGSGHLMLTGGILFF